MDANEDPIGIMNTLVLYNGVNAHADVTIAVLAYCSLPWWKFITKQKVKKEMETAAWDADEAGRKAVEQYLKARDSK